MKRYPAVAWVPFAVMLTLMASQIALSPTLAETMSLVDSTVVVPSLNYYTFSREIDVEDLDDVRIEGTIDVSDGFVSLYVMDSNGYQKFQQSGDADFYLYRADNIRSHSLNVPISKSGTYHIVLDNRASLFDSKTVRVQLVLSFERPSEILLGYVTLAILALIIVVSIVLVARRFRRKARGSAGVALTQPTQAFVPKYCAHCGAVMHQMARTCPACGREQSH